MRNVKIALLGLGNVGKGVWKILKMNKDEICKRSGYEIEVAKILVRDKNKKRDVDVPDSIVTTDFNDIINDDSISIVVELMGGENPAKEYMLQAMKKKKHVVTANKMVLATMGDELFETADAEGVMFYYEASVAGGIPIIHGINESLTANKIQHLYGILNGTTNYILSKMELEGVGFEDTLKEAQAKGYAEADPTSDVEGYDAAYKLAIVASLAFGTKVNINNVYREGITKISDIDIKYANEFGYSIKLLSIVKEDADGLCLRVHPTMIPKTHPLANVHDSFNAIFLKGNAVGDLMLYGRGAGELPTGSAVVGDILSILRSNVNLEAFPSVKNNLWDRKFKDIEDEQSRFYIRATVLDKPGVLGEITTVFGSNNISLKTVVQRGKNTEDGEEKVFIVMVTHKSKEKNFNEAIEKLKKLESVVAIDNVIRIENFI